MPWLSYPAIIPQLALSLSLICLLAGCLTTGFSRPPEHLVLPGERQLRQGVLFERRGEWKKAEEAYTNALQYTDKGYIALGRLHAQRGHFKEAEKYFRNAMRTIHDDASLYNDLAQLLLAQQKRLDEAEELARLSVKLADQEQFPYSWDTLNAVRLTRETIKKRAAAKQSLHKPTQASSKARQTRSTTSDAVKASPAASASSKKSVPPKSEKGRVKASARPKSSSH